MGKLLGTYTFESSLVYDCSVITVTTGTPGTLTITGHTFVQGDNVVLSNYSGTTTVLPTGIWASRPYYIRQVSGDTFKLSTDNTDSNLIAITGTGSANSWRIEKVIGTNSITFSNLKSKAVSVIYKNGGICNSTPSLRFTLNDIESWSYYYDVSDAWFGYMNSISAYPSKIAGKLNIYCNNNCIVYNDANVYMGTNVSNGAGVTGSSNRSGYSSSNASFSEINKIKLWIGGNYTYSFLHGTIIEVWDEENNVNKVKSVTASSNIYTLDLSQNDNFSIETTDTNNKTIQFSNLNSIYTSATVCVNLKYTNSASITYPNGTVWKSNVSPTLTSGKTYILMFNTIDSGATWNGSWIGAW